MKAIILAAGRGSRMKELTDNCPKCLIKLGRKSLLERQFEALRAGGACEIAIVTGYKSELLSHLGERQFHNANWQSSNMFASLTCAAEWLANNDCLISYSDIFYSSEIVSKLIKTQADIAVAYDINWQAQWEARFPDPLSDAESFKLDGNKVVEVGRKAHSYNQIQGQYMGLLKTTPAGFEHMTKALQKMPTEKQSQAYMTDVLQAVIASDIHAVTGCANDLPWGEIDSQTDLAYFNRQPIAKA